MGRTKLGKTQPALPVQPAGHNGVTTRRASAAEKEAGFKEKTAAAAGVRTSASILQQPEKARSPAAEAEQRTPARVVKGFRDILSKAAAGAAAAGLERTSGRDGGKATGCDGVMVLSWRVVPGAEVEMEFLDEGEHVLGGADRLQVISNLGKGGNGTVWRVRKVTAGSKGGASSRGPTDLALKIGVLYQDLPSHERAESENDHDHEIASSLIKEWKVMQACQGSDHITQCHGFGRLKVVGEKVYCLLLELVEGESVRELVRPDAQAKGLDPAAAHQLMKGIVAGLKVLHGVKVIHRDIKASNVVLSGEKGAYQPKLIDFGASLCTGGDIDRLGRTWQAGTPGFRPPEMREGCFHDSRVDSFQLGMTLVEIRFGEWVPFHHLWEMYDEDLMALPDEELKQRQQRRGNLVAELGREDCPYHQDWSGGRVKLTAAALDFLKRCLQPNPTQRESLRDVWFCGYGVAGPYSDPAKWE